MAKPELEFHIPTNPWLPAGVAGIEEQLLARDEATGADTSLLRWAQGTDSTPMGIQRHDYWEEVYILEGETIDLGLDQRFTAGMYACRPPGMKHGPWKSPTGYTAIVVRYGP